ncbi:MAG TPA: PIG-L family deacetylase [Microvirga sp.]|nr:PIG-L family deacetylase [Microvirga sp.]
MSVSRPAHRFLAHLAADERIPAAHVAVVVAHADDETIGLGAQLPRLAGVRIVHVTNGSPRNPVYARRRGFASGEAYAAQRQSELEAALALAGVPASALTNLGVIDQDAPLHLVAIARRLAEFFGDHDIAVVLTHAFEGGHPDHEATAFAVREAADLLARRDPGREPLIVEMPYYRAGETGWLTQSFLPRPDCPELTIWLDEAQRELKRRMYAAHGSQRDILELFPIGAERFRQAPRYDFTAPPHEGELLYEREDWGLTRERWRELVRNAQAELRGTSS